MARFSLKDRNGVDTRIGYLEFHGKFLTAKAALAASHTIPVSRMVSLPSAGRQQAVLTLRAAAPPTHYPTTSPRSGGPCRRATPDVDDGQAAVAAAAVVAAQRLGGSLLDVSTVPAWLAEGGLDIPPGA